MFISRTLIYHRDYFHRFRATLPEDVRRKIDRVLVTVQTVPIIPRSLFQHLEGTEDLYEIRVELGRQIFRIFCCFDTGNVIVLFQGFQKKSQKTPLREIEKATRLKREYFHDKATRKASENPQ